MNKISFDTARHLIRLDEHTGKLFWLPRSEIMFSASGLNASHDCAAWNTKFAGTEALNADHGDGYLHGAILGRKCLAHRAVWLLHYGDWPVHQVDHINGNRRDNRILNLRSVTNAVNGKNRRKSAKNSTGVTGVYWCHEQLKWRASICVDGRLKHLGRFHTIEEAARVRKLAEVQYSFHPNHGSVAL